MTPQEKIDRLTRGRGASPSPLAPAMLPVAVVPAVTDFRTVARSTSAVSLTQRVEWPETVAIVPETGERMERGSLAWRLAVTAFILLTLGAAGYVWFAAVH